MPSSTTARPRTTDADGDNRVFLRGRLADTPETRELPSGDVLATFRVTVSRPPGDRVRVDSLECASVRPVVHRRLARAAPGDQIELTGCLHRRFWRTPSGPASRYTVDVTTVYVRSDRGVSDRGVTDREVDDAVRGSGPGHPAGRAVKTGPASGAAQGRTRASA